MSLPIVEYIADNILDTVNGITTAAGYNQTLIAYRPYRHDYEDVQPEDGKVIIKIADAPAPDPLTSALQSWTQRFDIQALVIDSDAATAPIDRRLLQVRSDIEKALLADHTRGGYANETLLAGASPFSDGDRWTGIVVFVDVKYDTAYGDPYTGRS